MLIRLHTALSIVACAGLLAGCSAHLPDANLPASATLPAHFGASTSAGARSDALPPASKISHVIIVVQENRSFDNLFYGYPGANTAIEGKNSHGVWVPLQPIGLEARFSISHLSRDFFAACDGSPPGQNCKMDAFDREGISGTAPPYAQYAYVPHVETEPYFALAHQFVLGDNMFTSHIDASFVSHQYIIAGQSENAVDNPNSTWGCGGGPSDTVTTLNQDRSIGPPESPCFNPTTIADELDAKGLSWHFYAAAASDQLSILSAYRAVSHIRHSSQWKKDVITPSTRFLHDVAHGQLSNVTWITPDCADSDHVGCLGNQGPDWVASIVNAVGKSSYWNSSAIFVMWDEWGGWYDHVPPRYVDFDGFGFRVPLLVISPYAKRGHVSHVLYEHGSILKFVEDVFGLQRLAASDARANSPVADCFDFTMPPRALVPIPTRRSISDFMHERPDLRPPDEQ